jgi:plastocyanin
VQEGVTVPRASGPGWRRLLVQASVAQIVLAALAQILTGQVIPPLIVFAALLAVGIALVNRGRVGVILLLIVTIAHLVSVIWFQGEALAHPESLGDFLVGWATLVAVLLTLVATVQDLRPSAAERSPRALARVGLAVVVIAALVGLVATLGHEEDIPQEADLRLTAKNIQFFPGELSVPAGQIGVFVENEDLFRHTFAIEELDVEVELPAGRNVRVSFSAEPSSYEFKCSVPGHEQMEGTLTVE